MWVTYAKPKRGGELKQDFVKAKGLYVTAKLDSNLEKFE